MMNISIVRVFMLLALCTVNVNAWAISFLQDTNFTQGLLIERSQGGRDDVRRCNYSYPGNSTGLYCANQVVTWNAMNSVYKPPVWALASWGSIGSVSDNFGLPAMPAVDCSAGDNSCTLNAYVRDMQQEPIGSPAKPPIIYAKQHESGIPLDGNDKPPVNVAIKPCDPDNSPYARCIAQKRKELTNSQLQSISLGPVNISDTDVVVVMKNGNPLVEGIDYTIDENNDEVDLVSALQLTDVLVVYRYETQAAYAVGRTNTDPVLTPSGAQVINPKTGEVAAPSNGLVEDTGEPALLYGSFHVPWNNGNGGSVTLVTNEFNESYFRDVFQPKDANDQYSIKNYVDRFYALPPVNSGDYSSDYTTSSPPELLYHNGQNTATDPGENGMVAKWEDWIYDAEHSPYPNAGWRHSYLSQYMIPRPMKGLESLDFTVTIRQEWYKYIPCDMGGVYGSTWGDGCYEQNSGASGFSTSINIYNALNPEGTQHLALYLGNHVEYNSTAVYEPWTCTYRNYIDSDNNGLDKGDTIPVGFQPSEQFTVTTTDLQNGYLTFVAEGSADYPVVMTVNGDKWVQGADYDVLPAYKRVVFKVGHEPQVGNVIIITIADNTKRTVYEISDLAGTDNGMKRFWMCSDGIGGLSMAVPLYKLHKTLPSAPGGAWANINDPMLTPRKSVELYDSLRNEHLLPVPGVDGANRPISRLVMQDATADSIYTFNPDPSRGMSYSSAGNELTDIIKVDKEIELDADLLVYFQTMLLAMKDTLTANWIANGCVTPNATCVDPDEFKSNLDDGYEMRVLTLHQDEVISPSVKKVTYSGLSLNGTLNNNVDSDGDGVINSADDFPLNKAAVDDTDGDGYPDGWDDGCNVPCQQGSGLILDGYPQLSGKWTRPKSDYDADGTTDVILRDVISGDPYYGQSLFYKISAGSVVDSDGSSFGIATENMNVIASLDANGDNIDDVLAFGTSPNQWYVYIVSGGVPQGVNPLSMDNWSFAAAGDFNHDGTDDIVLRNGSQWKIYYLSNGALCTTCHSGAVYGMDYDASYIPRGAGDMNGDGWAELLFSREVGSTRTWYVYNFVTGEVTIPTGLSTDTALQFQALLDLNADEKMDVVLRNTLTGAWTGFITTGASFGSASQTLSALPDYSSTRSTLADYGDFDGDGTGDILLWNWTSSEYRIYRKLLDTTPINAAVTFTTPGSARWQPIHDLWRVPVKSDYDGDKASDVLMRNLVVSDPYVGQWMQFRITGGSVASSNTFNASDSSNIVAVTSLDANGDDKLDVLVHDTSDGSWYLYLVQSGQVAAIQALSMDNWTFAAAGDFNRDGTDDVVLRNGSSWKVYYLQGGDIISSATLSAMNYDSSYTLNEAGDLNGDGWDDLLFSRINSTTRVRNWYVYNFVTNTVTSLSSLYSNLMFRFQTLVDLNGDQKMDIVVRKLNDSVRANSTSYSLNQVVIPNPANGYAYLCTTAGVSNSVAITFNTTVGSYTSDGSVQWYNLGATGTMGTWTAFTMGSNFTVSQTYGLNNLYANTTLISLVSYGDFNGDGKGDFILKHASPNPLSQRYSLFTTGSNGQQTMIGYPALVPPGSAVWDIIN